MSDVAVAMPTFRSWTIGDVRVTRVLELPPMTFDPLFFFPEGTREEVLRRRDWLVPDFANEAGEIILHFQAFVIEAAGKRIMVDPCVGNDKRRVPDGLSMLDTPFLENLALAGFPRESIDYVLCTHLHVDHCGWNTMLVDGVWVPTFPNARYFFAKAEFRHVQVDENDVNAAQVFADSVKPIVDAGLAELIDPCHAVVEGVRLESTPGHTPGHCSVFISSNGQEAVLSGDVLHHPVQTAVPDLSSNMCWDADQAAATRRRLLGHVADHRALLIPAHFPSTTGVYVVSDGEAWRVEKT